MLSNYHRDHESEEQGSHSTEENLLTIGDLKRIFVDDGRNADGGGGDIVEEVLDDEATASTSSMQNQ